MSLSPLGQFRVKVGKESIQAVKAVRKGLDEYQAFLQQLDERHVRASYTFLARYRNLDQLVKAAGFQMEQVFPGLVRVKAAATNDDLSYAEKRRAVDPKFNPDLGTELSIGTSPIVVQERTSLWTRTTPKGLGEDFYRLAGMRPLRNEANDVGSTVLKQMGGMGKIRAMLGATATLTPRGVSLRWPSRQPSKGNAVEVELQPDDTYVMKFYSMRGMHAAPVRTYDGIHADQLVRTFEQQTGLALRL